MSSYNKTLLYRNNGSSVTSCTLSESASNFRRLAIDEGVVSKGGIASTVEVPSFTNKSNIIYTYGSNWSVEDYILRGFRISIDASGTVLSIDGYNILGTVNGIDPCVWGNDINNYQNVNRIINVYGVDRINYTEQPGIGSPGIGWRKYNETVLWAGTNTNTINLSESASNFERLRVKLGTVSSAQTYMEVDAPLDDGYILTTSTVDTESATIYRFAWSNWIWSNNCRTLTAVNGKSFRNTYVFNIEVTSELDNSDTDFNKRPILEIVGINRLEART